MKKFLSKKQVIWLLFFLVHTNLWSQPFVDAGISLVGVYYSSAAWGDYDGDGDLDILIAGSGSGTYSKIYRNDSGSFVDIGAALSSASSGSIDWGDYDNDGDLDILMAKTSKSLIYRNENSTFIEQTDIVLPGVTIGTSRWVDYDNDGDLDLMLNGSSSTGRNTRIYRNNGNNTFTEQADIVLPSVYYSSVDWGDYDNDGDLDILITGIGEGSVIIAKVYHNNGINCFSDQTEVELPGVYQGSALWGDYDNDGDLDILLTGASDLGSISKIFRNNGDNDFTEQTGITLTGLSYSSAAWGDYDNDGDLDLILSGSSTGASPYTPITKIYRNDGNNSFSDSGISIPGVYNGCLGWGDYDNDGDLDLLITGDNGTTRISKIYANGSSVQNAKPGIPSNLKTVINNNVTTFTWDKSLDAETPQNGLSYNLYIYESGQSDYKRSPHSFRQSDEKNGERLIAKFGNIQWSSSGYRLNDLPPEKTYYWTVQAVDAGLQGGLFSGEANFTMPFYRPGTQANSITFSNLQATQATTKWANGGGTKRAVFVKAATSGTADPVDNTTYDVNDITPNGWKCVYNGTGNSAVLTGLIPNNDLLIHVCEYNGSPGSESYLKTSAYRNPVNVVNTIFIEQTGITLTGIYNGSVSWIDYNNDGNLDIFLSGANGSVPSSVSKIYLNNGNNTFTEQTDIILKGEWSGSTAWGDYDNDGDIDLLLTGYSISGVISKIFRNDGSNIFSEQTSILLPAVSDGAVAWGDYDNDGNLDILITGKASTGLISKIFRNNGDNSFTEQTGIKLTGIAYGYVAWGDYDNDDFLDILMAGSGTPAPYYTPLSKIYHNNGDNSFTEQAGVLLQGVFVPSAAWGDYNNDGYLDFVLTGATDANEFNNPSEPISLIYLNNSNNTFTEQTNIALAGVFTGSTVWGDYDNDGDLDLLLTGTSNGNNEGAVSKIYRNNGNNTFTEQPGITLNGVYNSSVAWGDYDNDGDLDILMTGRNNLSQLISMVYRNEILTSNVKPPTPSNLQTVINNGTVTFTWDKPLDTETLQGGLNYNLYIYESGQNYYEYPPHAFKQSDPKNGKRLISRQGNIQWRSGGYSVKDLPPGKTYNWSVQAVDAGLLGGNFSVEKNFTLPFYRPVTQANCISFSNIQATQAVATWADGGGTKRAVFIKAASSGTADPVDNTTYNVNDITPNGWKCVYNGTGNSVVLTGLSQNTDYQVAVCEYNGSAGSELYLNTPVFQNPALLHIVIFTEQTGITLAPVYYSSAAWGDYDNDGDPDIIFTGYPLSTSKIYRNDGGGLFTEISNSIPALSNSGLSLGDYDNDNDLDVVISYFSKCSIYKNNGGGVFAEQSGIVLPAARHSFVDWGDYDNDGDLDLLQIGETPSLEKISKIYQNNGDNTFTEQVSLTGVGYGSGGWADYDNDGFLDVLISGLSASGPVTKIYRNEGENQFVEQTSVVLPGVENSSVAWGDYDNDGFPDILLTGTTTPAPHYSRLSKIYHNNGNNSFTEVAAGTLPGINLGSVNWVDFDNDGDLDIFLAGNSNYGRIAKIFRNVGYNKFIDEVSVVLTGVDDGSSEWGDYDGDGDLDLLLTGTTDGLSGITKIFRNDIPVPNLKPSVPSGLQSVLDGDLIKFTWNTSGDNTTPTAAILYNLRIGTVTSGNNIKSGQSLSTGKLLLSKTNTLINGTSYQIKLPVNKYYWSVQAVDKGILGGSFAAEQITACDSLQAKSLRASIKTGSSLLIRWENGNGVRRILFGRISSSAGSASPEQGKIYLPEPYFGKGDKISNTGWFCLFNGVADSATIYGLSKGYSYDFQVIEYVITGGLPKYFRTTGSGNPGTFSTSLFTEQTNINLEATTFSSAAWGDYDNDGDLDILMTGSTSSKIYKNNNDNTFTDQTTISLPDISSGTLQWGDYDNDDDLDILIVGNPEISKVYLNNPDHSFSEQTDILLMGIIYGAASWGDYDNDGDLDIIITGDYGQPTTKLYQNNGSNNFTEKANTNLPGVENGSIEWGDCDNDGDLDLLITGKPSYFPISEIYTNNGNGTFSQLFSSGFTGVFQGCARWGDYDNDGDLDVLITGETNPNESESECISEVYKNNGDGTFAKQTFISLTGVYESSIAWGDYDNDGDLDILLTGNSIISGYGDNFISKIYRDDGNNGFTEQTDISLTGVGNGSVAWGDYDNDGDLDILLTGGPPNGPVSKIYRNNTIMKAGSYAANKKPVAPLDLYYISKPEGIFLYWSPVMSDETPYASMSYNILVGSSPKLSDICSPQSSTSSGYRRIAAMGNAQLECSHRISNLPSGKYYWKVQAVDQGFAGGAWSAVDSFEVRNVQAFYSADEVCLGYPTHFTDQSVATEGIASWIWDFKDGTTSSVQNPVHTYSASGTYNVKLVITDIGGIKDSLEQDVIIRPKPLTGFSAPDVCQGIPLTVTNTTNLNGLTVSSWYWDFGDESTPSYNQQPAPHPYLNPGDYDIKLRAVATNGCADSITKTVTVGAYPVAAVTANAPLTFCSGSSVTLSVPYDPEYSYTWLVDGVPLTGGNSYGYVAQLTGDYSVKVVNPKGNCTTVSSEVSITSLEAPAAPYISKSGSQTFCEGDSVELSVTNILNYMYQWKKDGGLVGTGYKYSAKSSGGYSLTVKNTEGCSSEATDTVEVVVRDAPSPGNISVSGPSTFCQGGTVTLSVPATTGYTYKWKNEYGEITGATTSSYAATATGIYKLEVMNSTGCGAETTPVTVTVKPTPDKPVITAANYTPNECPGTDPIVLSAGNTVSGYKYTWIKDGELRYNDTLTYLEFYEKGIYKLKAKVGDCSSESEAMTITLPDAPEKPVVYVKGPVVWYMAAKSNTATQYQWYRNGEAIQGATNYIYVANKTLGTYKVAVGNQNNCFTMSDEKTIPLSKSEMTDFHIPPEYLVRDGKDPFGSLQIYPNPTAGVFTVEMENSISGEILIRVITEQGKEIRNIRSEKTTEHFITEIDLSDEPKGVCFIMLQIDNYMETRKVVLE